VPVISLGTLHPNCDRGEPLTQVEAITTL
jgi:hypothetical protein